jgi:hypothetical protein
MNLLYTISTFLLYLLGLEDLLTQRVHSTILYTCFTGSLLYAGTVGTIPLTFASFLGVTGFIIAAAGSYILEGMAWADTVALLSLFFLSLGNLMTLNILLILTGVTVTAVNRFEKFETLPGITLIALTHFISSVSGYAPLHL